LMVTWTYVVTNTGNVTLTDILVTDDHLGTIGTVASLAPGETTTLTEIGVAAAGQYENTGTASVWYGGVEYIDLDESHYYGFQPTARLTVTPPDATNAVGDPHTFTAFLEIDADGDGSYETLPTGEDIDFSLSGVGALSEETLTVNGYATVVVNSLVVGTSTVTANWNGVVAEVLVTATPDSGVKTWFEPTARLTLTPPDATNAIGDPHTFTAFLEIDSDGDGTYETTPSGEDIDFTLSGVG
ncbi:MAG: hypothetical protein PHW86_01745, partial [Candidatus Bipolaricaulis sp.]|nr:hypothetical protein [Candidatus Bipolaricaulis sp.]